MEEVASPPATRPPFGRAAVQRASDVDRILAAPRVELGRWPTPIDRLPQADGRELMVKRDDLCAFGSGGIKARKVEQIVGHLLARGHDELITIAGNVANVVFDLLPALGRHGIRARLFILDDPPMPPAARARVFREVRAEVELLGASRLEAFRRCGLAFARSRARGGRPFFLLPSLSHPAGAAGNARGFIEMVEQRRAAGLPLPETAFITVASGTTLAGFLLGEGALRRAGGEPIRVVGVQVYPGPVERWTWGMLRWSERALGLAGRVPRSRIEIVRSALGGGFARFTDEVVELCERVRAETGCRIDPIFGGKTWSVLAAYLANGGARARPALYWHCGYTPEWREFATAAGPIEAVA